MLENKSSGKKGSIIAIDGPVASGKGTIAPLLADKLQGFYLPTGVMYRCVVLYATEKNILIDKEAIIASLPNMHIRIRDSLVFLNNEDVTEAIRKNDISRNTSHVSGISEVRKALIEQQRAIGDEYVSQGTIVIAEGRDIGTVVFPNAAIKIYLTASPAVRARRRLEQLHLQGESEATYTSVFQDTVARDTYDQDEVKTLVTNPEEQGYTVVDSSESSQEDTLGLILRIVKNKEIRT